MKAQLLIIPAAILITTASFNSPAPIKSVKEIVKPATMDAQFAFFRTHHQGKGIVATWAVASSNGVIGFSLQRTYEDPTDPYAFWEEVSYSSCTSSRSYKYCDENVFPGYINYRVVALMIDGSSSPSEVSTVRIVSHK